MLANASPILAEPQPSGIGAASYAEKNFVAIPIRLRNNKFTS